MSQPIKRLGRFEILSVLGRGGMGTVYLATDPVIGRQVAIKEIPIDPETEAGDQEELRARFEQEFRSAGTLSHPNIVTIYDVGQSRDAYFIAMEYVAGKSLAARLRGASGPGLPRIEHWAPQIAAGLDYAHGRGIVHRDVKPANILVTADEQIKITDFGIAKLASSDLTLTGTVLGTPAYMAPEQIVGQPASGASDQFSFAVILYQMLTDQLPFDGAQPAAILYQVAHETPIPPCRVNSALPAAVDHALLRALAKRPDQRYASCRALAAAIVEALGAAGGGRPAPTLRLARPEPEAATPDPLEDSATRPIELPTPPAAAPSPAAAAATPRTAVAAATGRGGRRALVATVAFVALGALGAWLVLRPAATTAPPAPAPRQESPAPSAADAAPAVVEHRLTVSPSDADGAALWIDGVASERRAPAEVPLRGAPGSAVRLELRDAEGTVLDATEVTLGAEPPPPWLPRPAAPAMTLEITSEPSGAQILLDGRDSGRRTPAALRFEPGVAYALAVRLGGYRDATWRFTLAELSAGQRRDRRLHFPLETSIPPGLLVVDAPYPVTVESDATRLRQRPAGHHEIALPPGRHRISLVAEAVFLRQTYPIVLTSGGREVLRAPPAYEVRIGAQPGNGRVRINGWTVADSLPTTRRLVRGRHRFDFSWPDGRSRRLEASVSGQRTILGTPE